MRFVRNNAIAITALVFAFTGTGLAASHYVITSTKQIRPRVLRKLHGAKGHTGATGKEGPQGKPGPEGKQGPAGPFPATLPAGQTLTGVYNAEGFETSTKEASFAGDSISFDYPLASAPKAEFVLVGEHTAQCAGSASEPKAVSGYLCLYEAASKAVNAVEVGSEQPYSRFGDFISVESRHEKVEGFFDTGSWAVTGD